MKKTTHQYRIISLLFLMLALGMSSYAQTTLTGKVLDQKTKAPIPYASVYVENTFTGIATAEDGVYNKKYRCGNLKFHIVGFLSRSLLRIKKGFRIDAPSACGGVIHLKHVLTNYLDNRVSLGWSSYEEMS